MNTAGLVEGFGRVLERYRHERGLTIETLAAVAGLPEVMMKTFEAGDYGPTLVDFIVIANGLDTPPGTLLNDVLIQWKLSPTD